MQDAAVRSTPNGHGLCIARRNVAEVAAKG